jgi:hypothetical protein
LKFNVEKLIGTSNVEQFKITLKGCVLGGQGGGCVEMLSREKMQKMVEIRN